MFDHHRVVDVVDIVDVKLFENQLRLLLASIVISQIGQINLRLILSTSSCQHVFLSSVYPYYLHSRNKLPTLQLHLQPLSTLSLFQYPTLPSIRLSQYVTCRKVIALITRTSRLFYIYSYFIFIHTFNQTNPQKIFINSPNIHHYLINILYIKLFYFI